MEAGVLRRVIAAQCEYRAALAALPLCAAEAREFVQSTFTCVLQQVMVIVGTPAAEEAAAFALLLNFRSKHTQP